jgi:hypothetical protein
MSFLTTVDTTNRLFPVFLQILFGTPPRNAILSIAFTVVAFCAVLYAFWRRKENRWWVFASLIVTIFITVGSCAPAVLFAIAGKIGKSEMNSNKKLELLMWTIIGTVMVLDLASVDLGFIPLWAAALIAIVILPTGGPIGCFIVMCFLGPTRYLEFITKAKMEQNEVLAAQALGREFRRKRRIEKQASP